MTNTSIPFNRPYLAGKELFYIAQAVLSGRTAGDGFYTKKCQNFLEEKFNAEKILLTHSCTAALEIAAFLCEVSPGDEVILPSFTFVSTANAFYLRGAKPVFVDINKDTLNIDEKKIEDAITEKTKVIIPVHYAGVGCNMNYITQIAKENNIFIVEDAAQGVNAMYKDKFLGTIGDIGAYSFHETKNYICGEGGAIVINNPLLIERAEILREKGTDRSKFFRGEVDKYTWVDLGSSYLPSDILSAFLFAQLENMEQINTRRENLFNYYYRELIPLANDGKIRLPYISNDCTSNCHLFYIIMEDEETRDNLMEYLKSKGISALFHYLPLHLSKIGLSLGYKDGQLPVTEGMSSRLLRLPFFLEMSDEEKIYVVDTIKSFFK